MRAPRVHCSRSSLACDEYNLADGLEDCLDGDHFPVPVPFPSTWLGTLTVESAAADGQIVGSSMLVDAAGPRVSGLEGSHGGLDPSFPVVYRSYGAPSVTSSIALQSLGDTAPSFRLKFFSILDGAQVTECEGAIPGRGRTVIATNTALCNLPAGFTGSAIYLGNAIDQIPVAAATTVTRDDGGANFEGMSLANHASEGVGSRLSLPYVRWTQTVADTKPNTYLAIQNVGAAKVDVEVTYFNAAGTPWPKKHALTILPDKKKSSTPADVDISELGNSPFGAAAIVQVVNGTGTIRAVVRAAGVTTGEDYNGIPF